MKNVARSIVVASGLLFGGAAHAYLTAGELALTCAKGEMTRGGNSAPGWEQAACALVFSGYRDGIIEGSLRGAMAVYVHDPRVYAEVKGVKDVQNRITPVVAMARCGVVAAGDESVEALKRAFLSYVGDHPEVSSKGYQAVLSQAISEKLCDK